MTQRVLVVEDDAPLRRVLASMLGRNGYAVADAADGDEAIARLQVEGADLVLLDLSLPRVDGLDVLRRLRGFSDVPVVVLTVRDSKDDKVQALRDGADDYVTKPFDADELLARIHAALRRGASTVAAPSTFQTGDLTVDLARRTVSSAGDDVNLTPTEWRLLELLLQSDGRLLTYASIADEVRGRSGELDQRSLRVFVAQLRRKLGDDATDPRLIVTHFGLGLRWVGGGAMTSTDRTQEIP